MDPGSLAYPISYCVLHVLSGVSSMYVSVLSSSLFITEKNSKVIDRFNGSVLQTQRITNNFS